ncbi:MAG: ABC transporter ATP-binding protein [Alphaproteobacteria bacterium]|nr:ABC transporter ATP-binding protein [Alphaproteobacteria bacterium]
MSDSIEITGLTKNFDTLTAVDNLNLAARPGEVIALLGPNGAGKSTLMNMIAGYLAPTSGQIKILGADIAEHPLLARQNIGFLPEGSPLYPDMSVAAFLKYMAGLRGVGAPRLAEVAALAKIDEVMNCKIETLSKGYLRRVGFAQSILSDPPVLLLDEPTDGLDPNQKEHIRKLIADMGKTKTILISTHLLEEAETIAARIVVIARGQIKADGTLPRILAQNRSVTLHEAFRKLTGEER